MNFVLSLLFSSILVGGLAFIDVIQYTWSTVGLLTGVLMILTYLVVMR